MLISKAQSISHSTRRLRSQQRLVALLRWLGSPLWMLLFFVFCFLSAFVAMYAPEWISAAWSIALLVFAVSLLAAVATNARFRRDVPLLGLHLGLLAFVVLLAVSRLSYLDGAVTLTQGTPFDGRLHVDKRGPFHPDRLREVRFANDGVFEEFGANARWKSTINRVRWWDDAGVAHSAEIGDDNPLLMQGYRIYSTRNRGYAVVFRWEPIQGEAQVGTVQLAPGEFGMANEWQLPNGPTLWALLVSEKPLQLERGQRRADLGIDSLPHKLVIRIGERREELQEGQGLQLAEGKLVYTGLDSWMGYRVVYDPAMYWMAAAASVVTLCMVAFYARLFRPKGRRTPTAAIGEKQ